MPDHARMPMTALMRGGGRLSAPRGASRGGVGKAKEPVADRVVAKPFVKWAGGKRTLAPEIAEHLPDDFNDYWEPFVGGGAVFFHLKAQGRIQGRALLSDINEDLISAYMAIKSESKDVIKSLGERQKKHEKEGREYYEYVRNQNSKRFKKNSSIASRFIYLNKTCYNGLYRVNRSGKFNVPMGSYVNPNICDKENIMIASKALENASIKCHGFEESKPKKGDLVYCDPPYDGTFTGYTDNGFRQEEQKRLRDKCIEWRETGANVVISNNNTQLVRDLYKDFVLVEVEAARHINCDGDGRGKVAELVITGDQYR